MPFFFGVCLIFHSTYVQCLWTLNKFIFFTREESGLQCMGVGGGGVID